MGAYFANFIVYTIAMVGLIFLALFVYKKFAINTQVSSKTNFLKIEDALNLAPRKQLFVVRAGNEKFLIASDSDRTTLLSRLENKNSSYSESDFYTPGNTEDLPKIRSVIDSVKTNAAIRKFAKKLDLQK